MRENNENVKIQVASVDDAEELLAIYAPYVEKTAITFEYEVPSVEEFKGRIAHVLERFPYLKARKISFSNQEAAEDNEKGDRKNGSEKLQQTIIPGKSPG